MARYFDNNSANYLNMGQGAPVNFSSNVITLSAWYMPDALSGVRTVIGKYNGTNPTLLYLMRLDTANTGFWVGNGVDYVGCGGPGGATAGAWNHLCGVKDPTVMRAYLNGVAGSDVANTRTMVTQALDAIIGRSQVGEPADGKIAEVAIWGTNLSAGEVKALSRGWDPRLIRPQSLRVYLPIFGNQSPEQPLFGATTGTLGGTPPKWAGASGQPAHPPILRPQPVVLRP